MARKQPDKPRNGGQWTEARFRSFVKSALRSASVKWPPLQKAMKRAEVGRKINPATGRLCMHAGCESCGAEHPVKEMKRDHIVPIMDPTKENIEHTWDEVVDRMFVELEGVQILCSICHDKKTESERELKKESRRDKSGSTDESI